MTSENLEKTLRAYQKRTPFRSFRVRFVSGEHIDIDHQEALVIRGGACVYVSASGMPTLYDHESVSEVTGKTGRQSA
jgi:hypothetical protein